MKQTIKLILLFSFLAVIGIGAYLYNMSVNSPYRLSSEEAKKRIAAHEVDLVLDVRTEKERETLGYYPKSIWIPAAVLEKEIPPRFPDSADKSARSDFASRYPDSADKSARSDFASRYPDSADKSARSDFASRYPDKHMRVLIYCNTGHRARLATDKLREMGYSQVYYISSGWKSLV
jgi:rhodanese-related sulfurtransferase